MLHPNTLRRFEVRSSTGSPRIVSLPTAAASLGSAARPVEPTVLTTFEDAFRAALAQTDRDGELSRLLGADVYEI
jgi:hypothetical protein